MSIINKDTIQRALDKILKEDRDGKNQIPDPLRFSYLYSQKDKVLSEIQNLLLKEDYLASDIYRIDVPKENYTIRPMARPNLKDWVLYQLIVDLLHPFITDKISSRSYSIINFKNSKSKIEAWKKFDADSFKFYQSGYSFCVMTDISGYFENINLEELRGKIFNYIPDKDDDTKKLVNVLFNKILYKWSAGRLKHFGLPQGPGASSYLGDVYLDNIDQAMESCAGYIRYMDDIRIFCKSSIEAKSSLIKLIKELRKYKLNVNSKKTKLLYGKEILNIFDQKREILNIIQKIFDSRNKSEVETILPLLCNLFKEGFADKFSDRHVKFALFRLSIAKNSGIEFDYSETVDLVIKHFYDKPHLSDLYCGFLTQFPEVKIKQFLLNFLLSEENIYEWQELHVLRSLLEISGSFENNILDVFIERFQDRNKHWAIRSLYALIVGKYGNNARREIIKDHFYEEDNEELKRNILISLQELGEASRNDFYNDCKAELWPDFFIKYLKELKSPMYFWPYRKSKIEDFSKHDYLNRYE